MYEVFSLEELEAQITEFKAALMAVSYAQDYSIGNRRYTRADLPEIRNTLEWLNSYRNKIAAGCASGPQGVDMVPAR